MDRWYERSFGEDYMLVYKHRNLDDAFDEVKKMMSWLHVQPGGNVLDVCCGMGRHSLALAKAGFQVTGMDLSEVLLNEARRLDVEGKVRWVHGDMRDVPLEDSYDAVVNLFTSFGYFDDDEESQQVIFEMNRLLAQNGSFIIDYLNPTYVKQTLVPFSEREEEGMTIEERRLIEDGFVRKHIVIHRNGQEKRTYLEQVRLFELTDFKNMMHQANLEISYVYGDYDAHAYDPSTSKRMIMVGRKVGHVE